MAVKAILGHGANAARVVVSLCDYSGNWPKPYADAGYTVLLFDLKHGDDCRDVEGTLAGVRGGMNLLRAQGSEPRVVGVLCATPCTAFAGCASRWWPRQDADGTTALMLAVAEGCLGVIRALAPEWWALENPAGRIEKLIPFLQGKRQYTFHPHNFAKLADDVTREAYTKRTVIWGEGIRPLDRKAHNVEPIMVTKVGKNGRVYRGSWMWANYGGKSERTKTARSMTPVGFARAFAQVAQ